MKLDTRLALLASMAAIGIIAAGCGGTKAKPDAGGGAGGGSDSCLDDTDCPDSNLFFCNQLTSKCEPSCHSKDDCGAAKRGEFALDYCAGNLGCQCDEGKCVASLCSADADCGSQVCRNGACVAAPAATDVTSCQITPDYVVASQGANVKFWVSTWKGNDPIVLKDGINWTAAAPLSGTGTGNSATFNVSASNTAAVDAVTVTIGSVTCKAKVLAIAAPAAGSLSVVVTDELSGRPIQNATVVISNPTNGNLIGGAQTTGADGKATFSTTAVVNISVFHTDYNYLTIVGYDNGTGSRLVSAVVRRNQTDKFGGYKGTFTNVPTSPNIKAGIAGMSIPGSITDLSLTQLLGPTVPTDVTIGTIVNEKGVPLPAGAFLQYDTNVIKGTISAQGLAGVCTDANGAPNDTAIANGTCGTRTAWALAGDVPLSEISGAASAISGGVNNINYGQLLGQILPIFKRFNSSVSRDVKFTLKATPGACASTKSGCTGDFDFSNTTEFTTQDHDFQQIPLGFNFVVKTPTAGLPQFKNAFVDGLVILGGTIVPGRGVVPLGIGIGVNTTPVDKDTDKQGTLSGPGLVSVRMAPTHHGLEGSQYGIVALAASLKSATDSTAGIATSALFQRVPNNQLAFDPDGTAPVSLDGPFLTIPENARYNFNATPYKGLTARTFAFTTAPSLSGATLVRVTFTDRAEHRWAVLVDPTQAVNATAGFVLPDPAAVTGSWDDRTFDSGATGTRSTLQVQTLKLADDAGAPITFKSLVELNGTNADRLVDFTRGFTVLDYGRPEVGWSSPTNGGTVAVGGTVKVTVKHFKVGNNASAGDEGGVVVDCGTGGSKTSAPVYTDTSQGKGEINVTLPSGCTAGASTLTATLVDTAGNPIQPIASSSIDVTIQ
ncbi:MAG: hypothetical protein ACJ790_03635 [Myxococcaceae bacterium]